MKPSPARESEGRVFGRLTIASMGILVIVALCVSARAQQPAAKNSQAPPASSSSSSSQSGNQSGSSAQSNQQGMGDMQGMPGMQHGQMSADQMANQQMIPGHQHMGPHMHMTAARPATPGDWARADQVASELRDSIEKYKDYRVALADGFQIFMPNLPQAMYHFTSTKNGFLESFTFDPARPTSLLYKKTASGYELIGAMYTMPLRATEDEMNERIPLSVAQWHLHTNLCMPKVGTRLDPTQFGLTGSIVTKDACTAAGGRFFPTIFGWMVHVYPFESSREKIWEQ
jgi:hypothetical protein